MIEKEELPRFRCFRCERPVEGVEIRRDAAGQWEDIVLVCHGETEIFLLDAELWQFLGSAAGDGPLDAFLPRRPPIVREAAEVYDLSTWPGGRLARED
jgi:hypothetical protein